MVERETEDATLLWPLLFDPATSMMYSAHHVAFAQPDGPLLYGYADVRALQADPKTPFRFLFRAGPAGEFVVSSSASLGLDPQLGLHFLMPKLAHLPPCTQGEPSRLQMSFCLREGCDANVTITEEDGTVTQFGAAGFGGSSPTVIVPFAANFEMVSGAAVVAEDFGKATGVVIFGDAGPDPWAVYCVEGTATDNGHGGISSATISKVVRVGSFDEAKPVDGFIKGASCPANPEGSDE